MTGGLAGRRCVYIFKTVKPVDGLFGKKAPITGTGVFSRALVRSNIFKQGYSSIRGVVGVTGPIGKALAPVPIANLADDRVFHIRPAGRKALPGPKVNGTCFRLLFLTNWTSLPSSSDCKIFNPSVIVGEFGRGADCQCP